MKIYCHSAILLKNKINHSNLFQFRKRMEYPLIFLKKYIYLFENEKKKRKNLLRKILLNKLIHKT